MNYIKNNLINNLLSTLFLEEEVTKIINILALYVDNILDLMEELFLPSSFNDLNT